MVPASVNNFLTDLPSPNGQGLRCKYMIQMTITSNEKREVSAYTLGEIAVSGRETPKACSILF